MAIKYVKDFEFPAEAGFHGSNMPSKADMSAKGMPSRAKPNAPARGAARMESGPSTGRRQGYAEGGFASLAARLRANAAKAKAAEAAKPPKEEAKIPVPKMRSTAEDVRETLRRAADVKAARKVTRPPPGGKRDGYAEGGMASSKSLKERIAENRARIEANKLKSAESAKKVAALKERIAASQAKVDAVKAKMSTPEGRKQAISSYVAKKREEIAAKKGKPQAKSASTNDATIADETGQYDPSRYSGSSQVIFGSPMPYAKGGNVSGREMDRLPAKRPPGRTMDLAPSKPFKGQYQGYAKGGKVEKFQRGGPTSRQSTGPNAPRVGYLPNPFGKSIPFVKGPSGGGYQRSYKYDSPYLMDENFRTYPNPDYDPKYDRSGQERGYAKGGKVKKLARGGPTSREPTGPNSKRVGYIPNPFGKSIRFEKGPSGGGYQRSYKYDSPFLMDENFRTYPNPDYDPKYDQRETGPQMARGGKVAKRADGGMMSKGPATRGTPAKGRAEGRMDFAEKYAPGLSIDMPGKRVKKK